jgi:hypothetical protein
MGRLPFVVASALVAVSMVPATTFAGVIAEGNVPGQQVEVLDLKADGAGMVTLTLRITNNSDKSLVLRCALRDTGRNGDCSDVSGISLIDPVNKKRYLVVQDTKGNCLCTTTLTDLPAKGVATVWATFAAPPATVKTVSAIVPMFLPLAGVPVAAAP